MRKHAIIFLIWLLRRLYLGRPADGDPPLPHGRGFWAIDRVESVDAEAKTAVASRLYTGGGVFFEQDHFPGAGNLVQAGILTTEGGAQTMIQLALALTEMQGFTFFFTQFQVKFRGAIAPGSKVIYTAHLEKFNATHKMGKATCKAEVNDKLVAEMEFSFLAIPKER